MMDHLETLSHLHWILSRRYAHLALSSHYEKDGKISQIAAFHLCICDTLRA
ncbi:MAG: hypothetical protein L0Y56_10265 [Nitrospira sp.]|nr:hypothetical protein [Nitrospira sp.]